MQAGFAFLAGLLFGVGLIVSGMANPQKVLGFLDLAGHWDPSLAFVMAGAIGVAVFAFAWAKRRTRSLLGLPIQWPTARTITVRLVVGSAVFGIGWGLAGFCPGPALVSIGLGSVKGIAFVVAMLAGMALFEWLERAWKVR
ncbi:YeeE/YedE family protein [Burkholderia sp. Bp9031]|uniref:YeeE/YedE family protein n=1 Tax=Burkholderia sp. Bp9031 TaxID=2184566 RepID=UPI0007164996|nr:MULTISPECIES: YeeE/YedE family protein [Burkholderia]RQZ13775.1 YeeE/YedE family protein [Burkholderia sp. Bp9031]